MTATTPGKAPELLYEPSFCNQALLAANLPIHPHPVGVTYTAAERDIIAGCHGTPQERREAVLMAIRSKTGHRTAKRPVSVARPAPETPATVNRWHAPRPLVSGDLIRHHRERLGINRFSLARRIGVRYGTVSAWEQGRLQPSFDNMVALSELFDVAVADLGEAVAS